MPFHQLWKKETLSTFLQKDSNICEVPDCVSKALIIVTTAVQALQTMLTILILKHGLNCIMTSQSPRFLQILPVPAYGFCQVQYSLELAS